MMLFYRDLSNNLGLGCEEKVRSKKKWILLTILGLVSIILAFSLVDAGLTFQNEPDGFGGLQWGEPLTHDMMYLGTFHEDVAYVRSNDKMHVGQAQFYLIIYFFHGQPQKFMGATLFFKGQRNYELLKTILRENFGKEIEKMPYNLRWVGPTTTIGLCYDMTTETQKIGMLFLDSRLIWREKITAMRKEIEEAGSVSEVSKD